MAINIFLPNSQIQQAIEADLLSGNPVLPSADLAPNIENDSIKFYFANSGIEITKYTSCTINRKILNPVSSFSLVIEDENASTLQDIIKYGDCFQIFINDEIYMTGYVDIIDFNYNRNGGKSLTIKGRNKLGLIADTKTIPYVYNRATPTSSYYEIFNNIFNYFGIFNIYQSDDTKNKQVNDIPASQKAIGPTVGKTKKNNLNSKINRQIKPTLEEGNLAYVLRVCAQNKWIVELSADGETVVIDRVSYDSPLVFKLSKTSSNTNVLSGDLSLNWQALPSAMITEATITGDGTFSRNNKCVIKVSDIIGRDAQGNVINTLDTAAYNKGFINDPSAPKVRAIPGWLKNSMNSPNATNLYNQPSIYSDLPKRSLEEQLKQFSKGIPLPANFGVIAALPASVRQKASNISNLPAKISYAYFKDVSSIKELISITEFAMGTAYTNFFTLTYTVQGASNNNKTWVPNELVSVTDDDFKIDYFFWVKEVTITRSRSAGTITTLQLALPFCYQ